VGICRWGLDPGASVLHVEHASTESITGVITISAAHTRWQVPTTALVAIAVAAAVTWLIVLFVAGLSRKRKRSGFVQDTISRLMGLFVLSMGVQFALTGLHAFAP
jgi:multiple antibiotic resistance protein